MKPVIYGLTALGVGGIIAGIVRNSTAAAEEATTIKEESLNIDLRTRLPPHISDDVDNAVRRREERAAKEFTQAERERMAAASLTEETARIGAAAALFQKRTQDTEREARNDLEAAAELEETARRLRQEAADLQRQMRADQSDAHRLLSQEKEKEKAARQHLKEASRLEKQALEDANIAAAEKERLIRQRAAAAEAHLRARNDLERAEKQRQAEEVRLAQEERRQKEEMAKILQSREAELMSMDRKRKEVEMATEGAQKALEEATLMVNEARRQRAEIEASMRGKTSPRDLMNTLGALDNSIREHERASKAAEARVAELMRSREAFVQEQREAISLADRLRNWMATNKDVGITAGKVQAIGSAKADPMVTGDIRVTSSGAAKATIEQTAAEPATTATLKSKSAGPVGQASAEFQAEETSPTPEEVKRKSKGGWGLW